MNIIIGALKKRSRYGLLSANASEYEYNKTANNIKFEN